MTTARILADTGELRSGLILPAYVDNPRSRLYMPGHYAALALSYVVFGYGVFQSLLPSLASFVVCAVGVFLIGARLYGRTEGVLAAMLVTAHPANVTYAFTAMAELTLLAACVLAFCGFVHVPEKWRPYAAPLLLVPPFLFRETGALLLVPMLVSIARAGGPRRWARVAAAAVGSLALLALVNHWQVATGKESVPLSWVRQGSFNYTDAVAPAPAALSPAGWAEAISENLRRNAGHTFGMLSEESRPLQSSSLALGFATLGATLVAGLLRWRRDAFPLGVGLMALLNLLLVLGLYDVAGYKAVRAGMLPFPFCALALAGALRPGRFIGGAGRLPAWARPAILACMGASFFWWSYGVAVGSGREVTESDRAAAAGIRFMESLAHEEGTLLIAPIRLSLPYVVEHHPVPCAFPPANDATLDRLAQRFVIGTLVLPQADLGRRLSAAAIQRAALTRATTRRDARGRVYRVFQRPR